MRQTKFKLEHSSSRLPVGFRAALRQEGEKGTAERARNVRKGTRALGGAHVPPTKLFPRLAVNKTILKPHVAAATGAQYLYMGFSRRNKIARCSAYDIGESNPVPASGL